MTTTHETMTDTAYRGQEATSSVLHIWADSVKRFWGSPYGKVPSTAEVVDCYFDFAEHVLEIQREFLKSLVAHDGGHHPGYDKDGKYAAKDGLTKKN
ncbi:MAG: hypothetical protein ACRDTD_03635 [Pseudonocardiaceae bacterium]